MRIIPRTEWGFTGWASGNTPAVVPLSARTEFFVHYEGGVPCGYQTGPSVPRAIHAYHLTRGWAGIGYNFVVTLDGGIYEARGWDLRGAHCVDHNSSGIGVQVHIGGAEHPTAAALAACRWLYDELARKTGRTPAKRGHRDGMSTSCPGDPLYAWVRAGMPYPTTTPEEDDMSTPAEIAAAVWSHIIPARGAAPYTTGPARACDWLADARVLLGAIAAVVTPLPADVLTPLADNDVDPQVLAAAVANAIPPGIAALVADELTRRLAT